MRLNVSPIALIALMPLGACARREPGFVKDVADGAGGSGVVRVQAGNDSPNWAIRIDGEVLSIHSAELQPGAPQTVVLTSTRPGSDQSSILALNDEGEVQWRYRVSGDSPFGYRLLHPATARVRLCTFEGRQFFVVVTGGVWAPYSLELIEVDSERGFVPRYRFWNMGAIQEPVVEGGLIAFRCLSNSHHPIESDATYPIAVVVLSLREALFSFGSAPPGEGIAPWQERKERDAARRIHSGEGYLRCFLLGEAEVLGQHRPFALTVESGRIRATSEQGLTYLLDPDSGGVEVLADESYRALRERQQAAEPSLPSFEEHVRRLRDDVMVLSPAEVLDKAEHRRR